MIHPKKRTILSKFFLSLANFLNIPQKMKRKKRNILLSILIGAFLLCAIAGGTFYYYLFAPQFHHKTSDFISPAAFRFANNHHSIDN